MKRTTETGTTAEVRMTGPQAHLSIDGKHLTVPTPGTPEEGREAVKKRLILTAKLKRSPIRVAITEPDGNWIIIIHPDGEIEDGGEQEDQQDPEPQTAPAPRKTGTGRTVLKIGAGILAAAAGAGLVYTGLTVVPNLAATLGQKNAQEQAYQSCNQARADTSRTFGRNPRTTYRQALAVTTDQVQDPATVQKLHRLMDGIDGRTPLESCNPGDTRDGLDRAAQNMRRFIDKRRKLDRDTGKAAKAVLASRDAKDLDDARAALDAKKDEASRLLGDSDGKVADNATREALQNAIGQAGQTKGDKAQAWRDAVGPLQSAIDQVNASMQAKAQADQQAAEQAAQQAAQAAPQTALSQGGHTPSYRPPASPGGSAQPAPSAPKPGWAVPPAEGNTNGSLPDHL